MKKKMFGRLGAAAVALTLITTAMMSGTLAKYTSSYNGNVTAVAAAWSFKATSGTTELDTTNKTLDLGITTDKGIDQGKIAPGSKGKFDISVDNSASEVQAAYEIKIAAATADDPLIKKLEFSIDGKAADEAGKSWIAFTSITDGKLGGDTLQNKEATTGKKTDKVTVDWRWPEGAGTDADKDNDLAGKSAQLNITVTATQVAPTAETTPAP